MKNYFTSLKIALFAILSTCSLAANAADPTNKWFYVAAKAYPSGAGTVYVENATDPTVTSGDYKESAEVFYHDTTGFNGTFNCYAKPADGLKFIGWAAEEADGKISSIISTGNPMAPFVNAKTDTGADDGSTGIEPWPLLPDTTFVALFGYVDYNFLPGQGGYNAYGKVTMANPTAKIGEKVTLTATPDSACTFVKWIDNNGKEYADNPLTLTVEGLTTLTPVFDNPASTKLSFPADGGIMIATFAHDLMASAAYEAGVIKAFSIYNECWAKDEQGATVQGTITNKPYDEGYIYTTTHGEGMLYVGKGDMYVTFEDSEYPYLDTLKYTACSTEGFNIEDMPADSTKYYVLAEDHKFHQVTAGFVDADRWALAVPDSVGENSPVIDLILESAGETADKRLPIINPFDLSKFTVVATDINSVAVEPKTLQQIYDLGGRLVSGRQKGIVITEGKKYLKK